jgi:hypothetical protein
MDRSKSQTGGIAERIVANELEYLGFRVSDLNKEGNSANADLIAVKDGKPWQIQVKGAANSAEDEWWFQYGYCGEEILKDRSKTMFNRHPGFYRADVVVLAAMKSPNDYPCVVLPWEKAEEAAQLNLDREYRTTRRDGAAKKPGMVSVDFCIPRGASEDKKASHEKEQQIIKDHLGKWDIFSDVCASAASAGAPGSES